MGGQDCDGPWLAGPYWVTAHPVSWLPDVAPVGDDRQINSEDRRSVRLRVRPPPTGTHQCHSMTPIGIGMMLTVKLTSPGQDEASWPEDQAPVTAAHTVSDRARSIR